MRTVGKRGRGWWLAAGLLALPASFCGTACGSQASDEYQGEVLLTIQGNVNIETSTNLQLKLAFFNDDESAVKVMDGHVTGEFPAKFRFEVTDPPPEDTFVSSSEDWFGLRGKLAVGFLVLLPPDHASSIPALEDLNGIEPCEDEADADIPGCKVIEECPMDEIGDNPCEHPRKRKYSCTHRACQGFGSDGDPALVDETLQSVTMARSGCFFVPYCYSTSLFCSSPEECYREYYECDISEIDNYDHLDYEDNMVPFIEDCELVEETGGPLFGISDITSAGTGYLILYLTEDNPETPLGPMKQGYNVVQFNDLTREQWQKSTSCLSYDPETYQDNFGMQCDDAPPEWRVVDDSSISIDLGAAPSFIDW